MYIYIYTHTHSLKRCRFANTRTSVHNPDMQGFRFQGLPPKNKNDTLI